jgi:hypothetical protein
MPALTQYTAKAVLDFLLGGASVTTTNTSRFVALAYGTPGASFGQQSEFGTLTGYTRLTVSFQSASTANVSQASATNMASIEFGAFSSVGSAIGVLITDNQTVGSTNYLLFGTLATAKTFGPGDSLVFAAGSLIIVMN